MRISRIAVTAAASAALLLIAGCGKSPYVGKWSGRPTVSGPMAAVVAQFGESTLNLNEDGTGFAKLAPLPETPITWEVKEDKITLTLPKDSQTAKGLGEFFVATPSEDKQTLSVDFGPAKIEMKKQAEAK
jgi:hypothetical protein